MSAKACCIKIKNCGGAVLGNLKADRVLSNQRLEQSSLTEAIEFFDGVKDGTLFALENPEPDNPFTQEKEIELSKLIDELVTLSEDFDAIYFMDKVKQLMALSETI